MKKIFLTTAILLSSSLFAEHEINSINEYQRLTNSGKVIVDFYAPWCIPCKEMSKRLKKINWNAEGVKVYKVNVEAHPEIQQAFATESGFAVPYLIFKDNGNINKTSLGVLPVEDLLYYSTL